MRRGNVFQVALHGALVNTDSQNKSRAHVTYSILLVAPGWRTGECPGPAAAAGASVGGAATTGVKYTCLDCKQSMIASSEELMAKVIKAHKKKNTAGESQCQKMAAAVT